MYVLYLTQDTLDGPLNIRVQMDGKDNLNIFTPAQLKKGITDILKSLAKVFTSMGGDQNCSPGWLKKGELLLEIT